MHPVQSEALKVASAMCFPFPVSRVSAVAYRLVNVHLKSNLDSNDHNHISDLTLSPIYADAIVDEKNCLIAAEGHSAEQSTCMCNMTIAERRLAVQFPFLCFVDGLETQSAYCLCRAPLDTLVLEGECKTTYYISLRTHYGSRRCLNLAQQNKLRAYVFH